MKYTVQEFNATQNTWKDAVMDASREGWDNCSFTEQREAEVYAYLWCHGVVKEYAQKYAPKFEIGRPMVFCTNASLNLPVLIRIVEAK